MMTRNKVLFAILTWFFVCAALGNGCAEHAGKENMLNSASSAQGMAAFQTTFYAFAQTQNCVKCHGSSVSPYFASPDLNTAYSMARSLVDFNNPTSSIIATYAGNSHCGDTPCSDPTNTDKVKDLLTQWATAELSSTTTPDTPPVSLKYVTASLAVPANLPTLMSANPAVMRFDLSQLNPPVPALSGAILEIEVQLSNATEYRLSRPKIAGNSAPVTVSGIHIYVKPSTASGMGQEDTSQGNGWADVSATAATFALPTNLGTRPLGATPLTTNSINVPVQSASDMFTIGFEDIQ